MVLNGNMYERKEKVVNNIDILEELKEWFNNFDLDSIKHKPEEYIQAISTLIAENKELKEKNKELKVINKMQEYRISVIDERELISKSKIEEINKEMLNEENSLELFYRKKYCKEVLQSLLGKE